jgi:hypothetical protein
VDWESYDDGTWTGLLLFTNTAPPSVWFGDATSCAALGNHPVRGPRLFGSRASPRALALPVRPEERFPVV